MVLCVTYLHRRKLLVCTDEMRRSEIAHVVFICRGQSFTDSTKTAIRFLLWPRQKVIGENTILTPISSTHRLLAMSMLICSL